MKTQTNKKYIEKSFKRCLAHFDSYESDLLEKILKTALGNPVDLVHFCFYLSYALTDFTGSKLVSGEQSRRNSASESSRSAGMELSLATSLNLKKDESVCY